jgi:hypothetical protein
MIALISAVLVVFKAFATLCVISLILLVVAHFNVVSSCVLTGVLTSGLKSFLSLSERGDLIRGLGFCTCSLFD